MNYTATEDIRDVKPGEEYFALTDSDKGGRCILTGMFIAIWRTRDDAKKARNGAKNLTVVRCKKPE